MDLNHPTIKTKPSDRMRKQLALLVHKANVKLAAEQKGSA